MYSVHEKNHRKNNIINTDAITTTTSCDHISNMNSFTTTALNPSTLVHRKGDKYADEYEGSDLAHKPILCNDNITVINNVNGDVECSAHPHNDKNNSSKKPNFCNGHDHLCTEQANDSYSNPIAGKDVTIVDDKHNININDDFNNDHKNISRNNTSSTVNITNANIASYTDKCGANCLPHKKS